jgi:hypothetical protein
LFLALSSCEWLPGNGLENGKNYLSLSDGGSTSYGWCSNGRLKILKEHCEAFVARGE